MEKKYLKFEDLVNSKKYPFTDWQWRLLLVKKKENGLDKCSTKIGKRLIFREDLVDEWFDNYFEQDEID